jgi:hypothetical protein
MLLFTLLAKPMGATLNATAVYLLFAVCVMVSIAVVLASFIPIKSEPLKYLVYFIVVFLTVFLFGGGVLEMFPFKWYYILIVFGMLSVAYVGVVVVLLISEQMTAVNLNKKISEMKKNKDRREDK